MAFVDNSVLQKFKITPKPIQEALQSNKKLLEWIVSTFDCRSFQIYFN